MRKLTRRMMLDQQITEAKKAGTLRPRGTIDYKEAMSLLHYNVLSSDQAEDLYWAFIEGLWIWTPRAELYRVAVLQYLRTIAEAGIEAGHAARVQVYIRCPECKRHDFMVMPSGVHECVCGELFKPVSLPMRRKQELATV